MTIVSVVFENAPLLARNAAFVARLNGGDVPRWIVVDNAPDPRPRRDLPRDMEVVGGVAPVAGADCGSLHHARGLEAGLRHVRTRHALLMDADFYVVRRGWLAAVAAHVRRCGLALFGSAWHPAWYYQYRYFPSVHFMWIDGDRLPLKEIDLAPSIRSDRWWRLINDARLPVPFRKTLKATRLRDTGWALYHRYRRDPLLARECLVPHFLPAGPRYGLERTLRHVLPESWCLYPKDERGWTADTFLRADLPDAYAAGWEEFFWQGEPFAFHLRQVGRRMQGRRVEADPDRVGRALDLYGPEAAR